MQRSNNVTSDIQQFRENLTVLCNQFKLREALHLLKTRTQQGLPPSSSDYVCILQGCIRSKDLASGKQIHGYIVNTGFKASIFLWTAIMNMYVQCRSLTDARKVFDAMPEKDLLSWNMMIGAYAKFGHPRLAFQLFCSLELGGLRPDAVTLVSILKACSSLQDLVLGRYIHGHIMKCGVEVSLYSANTLITMYCKCGSIVDAQDVFDRMEERSVVSWTAMIAGYAQHGQHECALDLYRGMVSSDILPNEVTFVSALNACAGLGDLEQGKMICLDITRSGIKPNIFMENACIDMYIKCGSFSNASKVFMNMNKRDVVTWTTMIAGCAQQGLPDKTFNLFQQMAHEGHQLGDVSLVSNFNAFASLGNLEQAKAMHVLLLKFLGKPSDFVGSALVDMYVKCKSTEDAWQAFCQMPRKDVILWNAMLSGFANEGNVEECMKLLQQMMVAGVKPNDTTLTIILNSCASMVSLEAGWIIHEYVVKLAFESDTFVRSALVNMYTKCGIINEAEYVFKSVSTQDVVLYTSMIAGYAQHSQGHEALQLARKMQQEEIRPNHVTFVGILSACSHAGLIEEGFYNFNKMTEEYRIKPLTEHYVCIADLLGRAGSLDEAELYIEHLICKPDAMVWRALLGACRMFGDMDRAKYVANYIIELLPADEAAFVLLSNIAAGADDD